MTMMETGGEEPSEEGSQDSTPDSHRRRRLLAAHHKDFIGEDSRKSDNENCLMAMGRYDSNSSSQEEVPPANDEAEAPGGKKMRIEQQRRRKMWKQPRGRKTRTWMMSCVIGSSRGMHYRIQRLPHPWGGTTI